GQQQLVLVAAVQAGERRLRVLRGTGGGVDGGGDSGAHGRSLRGPARPEKERPTSRRRGQSTTSWSRWITARPKRSPSRSRASSVPRPAMARSSSLLKEVSPRAITSPSGVARSTGTPAGKVPRSDAHTSE